MTGVHSVEAPTPQPSVMATPSDGRGSPIPTPALIATRFMELGKRRGLMITLFLVTVGIPTVFVGVRLILHAVAPKTYGPAGGYDIYTALSAGVLYTFGFIVAATLGCTAGSVDLTEGMFRHLVVTGRSRIALYLARTAHPEPQRSARACSTVTHRARGLGRRPRQGRPLRPAFGERSGEHPMRAG